LASVLSKTDDLDSALIKVIGVPDTSLAPPQDPSSMTVLQSFDGLGVFKSDLGLVEIHGT